MTIFWLCQFHILIAIEMKKVLSNWRDLPYNFLPDLIIL